MTAMDTARVGRMTRDLIAQDAFPVQLVTVSHEASHWRVVVRDASDRTFDIAVVDTATPKQLRAHLREKLEEASA